MTIGKTTVPERALRVPSTAHKCLPHAVRKDCTRFLPVEIDLDPAHWETVRVHKTHESDAPWRGVVCVLRTLATCSRIDHPRFRRPNKFIKYRTFKRVKRHLQRFFYNLHATDEAPDQPKPLQAQDAHQGERSQNRHEHKHLLHTETPRHRCYPKTRAFAAEESSSARRIPAHAPHTPTEAKSDCISHPGANP